MSRVIQCDRCLTTVQPRFAQDEGWEFRWPGGVRSGTEQHICKECANRERTKTQRDEIETIMRDSAKAVAHLVKREKQSERPVDPNMFLGGSP